MPGQWKRKCYCDKIILMKRKDIVSWAGKGAANLMSPEGCEKEDSTWSTHESFSML
jgi:hypothetical protein